MPDKKIELESKKSFSEKLKSRTAAVFFGAAAFVSGFFFLSSGVTGNSIADTGKEIFYFSFVPLIGLVLIVCSLVLLFYAVTKKK